MYNDRFNDSLRKLLDEGRFSYALSTLLTKCEASLASHPSLAGIVTELEGIRTTYTHLRRFLLEGKADPGRASLLESLKEKVKTLAREYLFIINEDRLDPLFAEYRMQKVRPVTVSELLDRLEKTDFRIGMAKETGSDSSQLELKREEVLDALFRKVWSLSPGAREEFAALRDDTRVLASFDVAAQVISALLLGLMKFNDPSKTGLLLDIYERTDDDRVAARALTAIVLTIGRWGQSAVSTPELESRFRDLEDSLLTYSRVREIVMTLIKTRDTDRVSREVSEAFRSTMKEITPEMLEKLQKEGLTADSSETGMNPEWEKLMQNKELEDKMKVINDMQLEGMDVMMQTFARLKTFPFFRKVSSWFLPFSPTHSSVAPLFQTFDPEGFGVMADATDMCASDRYSFALGIMQMPEERRNMLAVGFGSQLDALRDMMKDRENVRKKSAFSSEALVYARDLYRFAKLFPSRKDFHDPFESPIDFLRLPMLGSLLSGDDIILTSADFYFRHGYYPLALSLYSEAERTMESGRELYEKIGFCHQMAGDYAEALSNYEKADLFSTDSDRSSTWLVKKLAFTNKAVGNYGKAAEYYRRLLERDPDNLKTEFHLGSVLLRTPGGMEEGKNLISKVHYLDPSHEMAARIYTRLKGHDAFMEGRYADALTMYEAARGGQDLARYAVDLATEIKALHPEADISALRILLDS